MDRNESSRLGDLQSEGNLGNERNRSSERGTRDESVVNRSDESSMGERDRSSEERGSGEEWSPTSETEDNNDARRGGYER
jgi:hypothetical protein